MMDISSCQGTLLLSKRSQYIPRIVYCPVHRMVNMSSIQRIVLLDSIRSYCTPCIVAVSSLGKQDHCHCMMHMTLIQCIVHYSIRSGCGMSCKLEHSIHHTIELMYKLAALAVYVSLLLKHSPQSIDTQKSEHYFGWQREYQQHLSMPWVHLDLLPRLDHKNAVVV